MKKSLGKGAIIGIGIAVLAIIIIISIIGFYNSLVTSKVAVDKQWGNVQSVYQRRADLIPNLVETVKGSANFETNTQTKIAELRTQAGAIKQEIGAAQTPQQMDQAASKLQEVVAGYRSLNINVENYPDLKSNQNFLGLQDELANSENKIAVERQRYNDVVGNYNLKVMYFPGNLLAGMFGFKSKDYFQSAAGSENAPKVQF